MRVTLLKSLAEAINKVHGNSIMIEEDSHYDEYYCVSCKNRVYESEYNHKHSQCYSCWYKE